jgi:hypothetical protein
MNSQPINTQLKLAAVVTTGFGILTALAAWPATNGIIGWFTDVVFWPFDGSQTLRAPETRLFCAISGGVLTAFGVLLWQLATRLYPVDPQLTRTLVLSSAFSWFAVDSIGSIAATAPGNALLNIPFLLMLILPVWRRDLGQVTTDARSSQAGQV